MNLSSIFQWLKRPYPFYYVGVRLAVILLFVFSVSFYITYFLAPHNISPDEHKVDYFWICVVHSFIPVFFFAILSLLFQRFFDTEEKWNIQSEIVFIAGLLLSIGLGNFFVRDLIYDNPENWTFLKFWEEVTNTLSIGLLIAFLVISVNYNFRHYKFQRKAKHLKDNISPPPQPAQSSTLRIETQLKKETFDLHIDQFVFAKAEGNYTEIYLHDNAERKKLLKRITLSALGESLEDFPNIVRTHKSYLVNLNQIIDFKGNAAGLKLKMKNFDQGEIPVSRKNIAAFDSQMEAFRPHASKS